MTTPTLPPVPSLPPPTASVVTISYQDLKSFDPCVDSPSNNALIEQIGKAFGNKCSNSIKNDDDGASSLGILAVEGIPQFAELRQRLLPLASRLPTLPDLHDVLVLPETLYSTGWSHGKEQLGGKPDLAKGSFYANPLQDSLEQAMIGRHCCSNNSSSKNKDDTFVQELKAQAQQHPEFYADNVWPEQSLPELRSAFMELGQCMVQTGRFVAAVCDAYCAKQQHQTPLSSLQLCKTLTESLNCKGRLLHYFPVQQQPQEEQDSSSAAAAATSTTTNDDMDENLWCGWHNDHGSLTALAPALYMNENGDIVEHSDPTAGLFIQSRSGQVVRVCLPPTACGFQIGETSQIQSGGLLQATPHAVRPGSSSSNMNLSRESFAVFMEPEFNTPLHIPVGKTVDDCQEVNVKLPGTILPLRQRWQPGQTFGDFHVATVTAFCSSNTKDDKDRSAVQ